MRFLALVLIVCGAHAATDAAESLRLVGDDKALEIYVGDQLFTRYTCEADQKYPYFFPVNGPQSGISVTTETSEPYPHHHSLFFGCDKVNNGNFWQEENSRGQIQSVHLAPVLSEGPRVVFSNTCLWQVPGDAAIMRDVREITVSAPDKNTRMIDFAIELEALVDITITKTNHSLFSARMTPELAVTAGGVMVNAEGGSGEKGTWGIASPWMDYSGTRDGVTEGLAILQHPDNWGYPAPWFTRDYGFFSPTPMYWLENDRFALKKGEKLPLKYRVVVHSGNAEAGTIASHFADFCK